MTQINVSTPLHRHPTPQATPPPPTGFYKLQLQYHGLLMSQSLANCLSFKYP